VSTANVILTFEDEHGREWLAAGEIDYLRRYEGTKVVEALDVERSKDRVFKLTRFSVIDWS
jgi:hypothetical protein